jgi:hypothetical protein
MQSYEVFTKQCRYFLFSSALVVLSSEFSDLYPHITINSPGTCAIEAMAYYAENDPQGSRLHFILTAFRDVVVEHRKRVAQSLETDIQSELAVLPQPVMPLLNEHNEPMNTKLTTSQPLTTIPSHPAPATAFRSHHQPPTEPIMSPPQGASIAGRRSTHIFPPEFGQDHREGPSGLPTPQSSRDPFLELAHVPSEKVSDGGSLMGEGEIDFESLWQWPNHEGTGLLPTGVNLTPGGTTLMPGGTMALKSWPR